MSIINLSLLPLKLKQVATSLFNPKKNKKKSKENKEKTEDLAEKIRRYKAAMQAPSRLKTIDELTKYLALSQANLLRYALIDQLLLTDLECEIPTDTSEVSYMTEDSVRGYYEDTFEDALWSLGILDDMFRPSEIIDAETVALAADINTDYVGSVNMNTRPSPPQYIVIHYVVSRTSKKGTAKNVINGYLLNYEKGKKVSSEFVVDDGLILQYCPDPLKYYCFAAGGQKYNNKGGSHKGIVTCRNSISIEVCNGSKDGKVHSDYNNPNYYFTPQTLANTIKLTKILMQKYNIPVENVVRHYDCTGKPCPGIKGWNLEPGSEDESQWYAFKQSLIS